MQKWEYRIVDLPSSHGGSNKEDQKELDQLGEDGWELVAMIHMDESVTIAYLKREKQ